MHLRHLAVAVALCGCHVRSRVVSTHPGASVAEPIAGATPRPKPPTVVVTPEGRLRFVEPLLCEADVFVELEATETVTSEPNLATAVVGIVVTVAGVVMLSRGLGADENGFTAGGALAVVAGAPFAIGPWIGNGETDRALETTRSRKGGGEAPCGERPVTARTASVRSGRFQAFGTVDADGVFSVSPYTWVDVFAVAEQPALDITADLVGEGGITTIETVIEASELAGTRAAFLEELGIDARGETMRKVPTLEMGGVRVSRRDIDGTPFLRIVVPIYNRGPGEAWQVRGVVEAPHAEVDGRLMYIGHLPKGGSAEGELLIPLSAAAEDALGDDAVEIAILLREAHGAAPEEPARFKGRILADVPR